MSDESWKFRRSALVGFPLRGVAMRRTDFDESGDGFTRALDSVDSDREVGSGGPVGARSCSSRYATTRS